MPDTAQDLRTNLLTSCFLERSDHARSYLHSYVRMRERMRVRTARRSLCGGVRRDAPAPGIRTYACSIVIGARHVVSI